MLLENILWLSFLVFSFSVVGAGGGRRVFGLGFFLFVLLFVWLVRVFLLGWLAWVWVFCWDVW